jgi:hypothetical protein
MIKTKIILASLIGLVAMCMTSSAMALSGANADEARIKIFTKQGGDWFRGLYVETNDDSVLKVKNVLPGKYKIRVRDKDVEDSQVIAGEFRMLDDDGKKLREETNVDVYMYINDVKTLIAQLESDDDGWISLSSIVPESVYEFNVKDDANLSSKDDKYRIKVNAKLDDSDWYRARYERTDTDKILKIRDVLPGKYKFKYKSGDATANIPFVLKVRLLDEDAERLDEETAVELYAYVGSQRALVATLQTDDHGWLTIPGVLTEMKYKIKVK